MRLTARLRELRGVATVEDYLGRVIKHVAPAESPSVPMSIGALDLPYAIGYLDAVWQNRHRELAHSPGLLGDLHPYHRMRLERQGETDFRAKVIPCENQQRD